uniref:RNB domain protein n=1 Tax=Megaviridae environmental sample TaxID=1737588 RepID=A0A5J6VIW7_9VIRU|nr:MAG: RNB domain protein [Megaviridae environmental sample]
MISYGILYTNSTRIYIHEKKKCYPFRGLDGCFLQIPCKKQYRCAQWAKIHICDLSLDNTETSIPTYNSKNHLIEILGRIHDPQIELHVYYMHFVGKTIPPVTKFKPQIPPVDSNPIEVFSVDPESCIDIDDAIRVDGDEISVSIASVGEFMSEEWWHHAHEMGSTIYMLSQQYLFKDKPKWVAPNWIECMFPNQVKTSLLPNQKRRAITVYLTGKRANQIQRTNVINMHNYSYEEYNNNPPPQHKILSAYTNCEDSHDIIEYLMIKANTIVAEHLKECLCRSQDEFQAAEYRWKSDPRGVAHASLALPIYGHFTSPIRRFADIHTHYLLLQELVTDIPLKNYFIDITQVNRRSQAIRKFHNKQDLIIMVHMYKEPIECTMKVRDWGEMYLCEIIIDASINNDHFNIMVNRNYLDSLCKDSLNQESLTNNNKDSPPIHKIRVWGVHRKGFPRLEIEFI